MRVDTFQQVLDAESLAADVLHLALVLFVDGLHDKAHQHRAFAAQLFQIDFLRVVRAVHRAAVMDESHISTLSNSGSAAYFTCRLGDGRLATFRW